MRIEGRRAVFNYTNEERVSDYESNVLTYNANSEIYSSTNSNTSANTSSVSTEIFSTNTDGTIGATSVSFTRTRDNGTIFGQAKGTTNNSEAFLTTVSTSNSTFTSRTSGAFSTSGESGSGKQSYSENRLSQSALSTRAYSETVNYHSTASNQFIDGTLTLTRSTILTKTGSTSRFSSIKYSTQPGSTVISSTTSSSSISARTISRTDVSEPSGETPYTYATVITDEDSDSGGETTTNITTSNLSDLPVDRFTTNTTTTSSLETNRPNTTESTISTTLTNASQNPSTFSYTFISTSWDDSTTYNVTSITMTESTSSEYRRDVPSYQQTVIKYYNEGSMGGFIPISDIPNDASSFDYKYSDLTSSISHVLYYVPNRTDYDSNIEVNGTTDGSLTYTEINYFTEPETITSTKTIFSSFVSTAITTTESTITGNFSFFNTTSISSKYTTEEKTVYNPTTSTFTDDSYPVTTYTLENVATMTIADRNFESTDTYSSYDYSDTITSFQKTTSIRLSSRKIAFYDVNESVSFTSHFLFIDRVKFPYFFEVTEVKDSFSIYTRQYGGLGGFMNGTSSDDVTGIPTIEYRDQYITTGTKEFTEVRGTTSSEMRTVSSGTGITNVSTSFNTSTTTSHIASGNIIETTTYTLQAYDSTYKLNRYYTFIPTNSFRQYEASQSSFKQTDGEVSVTYSLKKLYQTSDDTSAPIETYSSILYGIRETSSFGSIETREYPQSLEPITTASGGEKFIDEPGTIFLTSVSDGFHVSLFTDATLTDTSDVLTFDFNTDYNITLTVPKHKICKVKNTYGLVKNDEAFIYDVEGDPTPVGSRLYLGVSKFPAFSVFT